ncbi:LysR family transcriptional regulator [Teredinibacter sp. KSP-S5-2]|uniref:LysR family transcriptional regulator n=1 Tax=Teredinibacter sp. KSP-S5-2 TaxID=3034506 RepID=UPI002934B2D7|nr:LysR family transcriptional regulator [Teredinibacter sp. KSP-S5-2]WNO10967.1 LysR family transcriptional regulator [Teredinibacter sp. KSP-S5-2]
MDTDSLKAFISVAKHGSFSKAAEELFLTQPAVSKRIAALENELNHSLFDRLGRETMLTEAGQVLLPEAQSIMRSIETTKRSILELSGEIVGTLRVATSHHIGLHHLPPVLRKFAAAHKEVNLQFDFLDSEQAHFKVAKGECELAIVTLAPIIEEPLQDHLLWHDPLVFVVGQGHHLANKKSVTLKELSNETAILPSLATFTGRLLKECFDNANLPLTLNMTTNYLETIKMMVSVGLGWSLLPKKMVDEQLICLNVPGVSIARELGIITHKKRSLGNAARAFFELLCESSNNPTN